MLASHRHLDTALILSALLCVLPVAVHAQAPVYILQWGTPGSGPYELNNPSGVATNAAGDVYVADFGNQRIQKFSEFVTPAVTSS